MKQLFFAIGFLMSAQLFAQNLQKPKTTSNTSRNTAYGALATQYSRFNGDNAIFSGVYGGLVIKQKVLVGLGGYGLMTQHKGYGVNAATHEPNKYKMGYVGVVTGYNFYDNKKFHASANALLGGGVIKNGKGRGTIPENGSDELKDIDGSGFYVVQPSVNVEYAVADWFRVGADVGYRYITGSDQTGITDRQMSAPTAGISLKFGGF